MSIESSSTESISQAQKYGGKPASSQQSSGSENSDRSMSSDKSRSSGRSDASNELKKFIADIEDLFKEGASLTGEEFNLVKEKFKTRVEDAKESVEQMGGNVADKARKGASTTNEYVHNQPWKAIGAGAAVGLLVGILLARRS